MGTKVWEYRDAGNLTRWVTWLLYAQVALALVALWSGLLERELLGAMQSGEFASEALMMEAAEASDARQALVALLQLLTFLVSGILIMMWIYRANANTWGLGAADMKFTPGWSIGWYFIPIANLWKPFQAMKEIVNASGDPENRADAATPSIVSLWWTIWLATGLLNNMAMRASLGVEEIEGSLRANMLTLISDAAGIPLAIVTLMLVLHVAALQKSRRERLAAAPAA